MKTYKAIVTQDGTATVPSVNVLQNDFAGAVVWTYDSAGVYPIQLPEAIDLDRTAFVTGPLNGAHARAEVEKDSTQPILYTYSGATSSDGLLQNCYVEITQY